MCRIVSALFVVAIGFVLCVTQSSRAALVINTPGVAEVIDFETTKSDVNVDAYVGTGFTSSPLSGQLDSDSWAIENNGSGPDSDMAFGETRTVATSDPEFARGYFPGAVTDGGIYSFDTDNDGSVANHALGIQPTTSMSIFNPGTITLSVLNSTGSSIDTWDIDYDLAFFNDQDRSSTVSFSYSTDNTTYSVPTLVLTTPDTAGAATWTAAPQAPTTISATVADTGNLYLRWTIAFTGGGSSSQYDQLALDNISVTAVPEPAAVLFGGLVCGVVALAAASRRILGKPAPINVA